MRLRIKTHRDQTEPNARVQDMSRKEVARRFRALGEGFAAGMAQTEHGCVELEKALREIHSAARELTELVSTRAGSLRSALTEGRVAGPDGLAALLLKQLRGGLKGSVVLAERLKDMSEALGRLQSQVHGIGRIGMFLKSWVVCFAVESARSRDCQEAFGSFIKDLRKLADRVAELGETISERTRVIRSSQAHGLETMVSSLSELDQLAQNLEGTANITAAKAQEILDGTCATLEAVEAHSHQIALHAGEAVYYMQFGDITRQKLEHVSQALNEAAQAALAAGSEREFRIKAAELECVAAIQTGQVESVRAELQTAHSKLRFAFEGIAEHTSRLAQAFEQSQDSANCHSSANDALQTLEKNLRQASELHHAGGEIQCHARDAAREAAQGCTQLAQWLEQVSAFNRDMHLQALSAIIKTAALGQQGATLDVLSMRMGWLSGESNREVEGIVATIQTVLDKAKDDIADSASAGSPADAATGLPEGLGRIAQVQAEFAQTATEASSLATRQKASLQRSAAVVEFLKDLAEALASHLKDLNSLREDLGLIKSADASGAQALASLGQRYTMQGEREIHHRFLQAAGAAPVAGAESPAAAAAEAAPAAAPATPNPSEPQAVADGQETPAQPVASPAQPSGSDAGDNVEFF